MGFDVRPGQQLLPDLSDADRQRLAGAGWGSAGAWTTSMDLDPRVLDHVAPSERELLERVARGNPSEVWLSADGRILLEVERYRADPCWQLLSLLGDGTIVRTALHTARDDAGGGRLPSAAAAGYDRETLIDRPFEELERRHRERLRAIAAERRSEPHALTAGDHPRVTRRVAEIVDRVSGVAAPRIVGAVLVAPPLLASAPIPVAWALGGGYGPAALVAGAILVAWAAALGRGLQPLTMSLMRYVMPHVGGERIPARRLLGH